jgi:hypothetical protein
LPAYSVQPSRHPSLPCKETSDDTQSSVVRRKACVIAFNVGAEAADRFQRLTGPQIRAKFSGMEMTDEVHWGDVYAANGTLTSYSMGRKTVGKWRVQSNELCLDRGDDDSGCYAVWMAGKKVELRRVGSQLPLDGVLQRPSQRR